MVTTARSTDEGRRARQLARLTFWRAACAEQGRDVVAFDMDGHEPPLFFFHGDFKAGGTYMARFAAAFGRPLVSIAPHIGRDRPLPPSLEAIAAERSALVLALCPSGPFRLGGYCNGGLVAYAVARRLAAEGHAVERVVMVEPLSLSVRPVYRALHRALARLLGPAATLRLGRAMYAAGEFDRAVHLTRAQAWNCILARGRGLTAGGHRAAEPAEDDGPGPLRAYADLHRAYLPQASAFPVTVLSSGRCAAGRPTGIYDGTSWRRLCAAFTHVRLEGSHLSCLMETTARVAGLTAQALDAPAGSEQPAPERAAPRPMPTREAIRRAAALASRVRILPRWRGGHEVPRGSGGL